MGAVLGFVARVLDDELRRLSSFKPGSSLHPYGAEAIKFVVNHGVREFGVGLQSTIPGFILVAGTYYCVSAYRDIQAGNIRSGLIKSAIGASAVAASVYNFISTWSEVIEDASRMHCRRWFHIGTKYTHSHDTLYAQTCSAFGCSTPKIKSWDEVNHCPILYEIDMGTEGFANVYDMKNADTFDVVIYTPRQQS